MQKCRVLLVDDDADLRASLRVNLEFEGFEVEESSGRSEMLMVLEEKNIDAVLLDLILGKMNGLDLIQDIKTYTQAPIIVVSGKSQSTDRVMSLEQGADDYMAKPVDMDELCARIRSNIRQIRRSMEKNGSGAHHPVKIKFGRWVMDCAKYQIFDTQGRKGDLTTKEFQLLETLVSAKGRALSREQLFEMVRVNGDDAYDRAIDVQITRIRKKIGDDAKNPHMIKTVRGIGYMFEGDVQIFD
jgi:two-component system, OmpR family, response regulator